MYNANIHKVYVLQLDDNLYIFLCTPLMQTYLIVL